MIAMLSSWSGLPQVLPNIIAPRQNGLTRTPVEPSTRVVITATLRACACRPGTSCRRLAESGPAIPATIGHPVLLAALEARTGPLKSLHVDPIVQRFLG